MADQPRVAIIGGGLGGLCLAQGLRAQGIPATVYERDPSVLFRRQGYRIHIGPVGAAALRQCLSPALYNLFLATAGGAGRQVTVLTSRLRMLKAFPSELAGDQVSLPVNRLTLREGCWRSWAMLCASATSSVTTNLSATQSERISSLLIPSTPIRSIATYSSVRTESTRRCAANCFRRPPWSTTAQG